MAQSQEQKQAFVLLDLYVACYLHKYKRRPQINRYRDKWGFIDMASDMDMEDAQKVIEYYFKTSRNGHPLTGLFNTYDTLLRNMRDQEEDRIKREKLREETRKRVEAMNGQRTEGD